MINVAFGTAMSVSYAAFCAAGTQWVVLSARSAKSRVSNAHGGPKLDINHAPTAVGGTSAS